MSVVCVVRKQGVTAIAADTQSTAGSTKKPASYKSEPSKIIPAHGNLLGVVGYCAHQMVIRDLIGRKPELFRFTNPDEIFRDLQKVHEILKDEYHLQTSEGGCGQPYESTQLSFCVATPDAIYEIDSYREVTEIERFWAIGSGNEYALGAMHAAYDCEWLDAREIAEAGARAAACFDIYCGEPIESQVQSKKSKKRAVAR
ncbi:MFS transporter [Haloferula helveola]|uniref:MFS transporter n=1 Tax=Haloferula helveola TaxID=490095 RepID=A0ABN6H7Z3_9BACT|nr:MFS transporter [Haloferula helveola]